jgi:hypothetical protein
MSPEEARQMQRDLLRDVADAAHAAQAKLAEQAPPAPSERPMYWMGEMLHRDDTTRYGW